MQKCNDTENAKFAKHVKKFRGSEQFKECERYENATNLR